MLIKRIYLNIKKSGIQFVLKKAFLQLKQFFNPEFFKKISFWMHTGCWMNQLPKNIIINGISKNIHIDPDCNFYSGVILEIAETSELRIGKNCTISYNSLIACRNSITIGENVMIGENTSIRDSTHDYKNNGLPMKLNGDKVGKIEIANNVWIGRGCIVLPDTVIEEGVVVGANSIIKGHLKRDNIYVGSPVKIIKNRN